MKPNRSKFLRVLSVFAIAWACLGAVRASAESFAAVMLVATPEFADPLYGATVVVATPVGNGQYLGFIVNKPTRVTLAEAFPDHAPSHKSASPLYLGGPEEFGAVFALVHSSKSPGTGSMQLAPDLFVAFEEETVDQVIERDPGHARFVLGAVVWKPGELESEIKRGAWYVDQPETSIVMRQKTEGLWEELVKRVKLRRDAI